MATRAKTAKKTAAKKTAVEKSPSRILMPAGVKEDDKSKKKSPARILLPSGVNDDKGKPRGKGGKG